MQEIKETSYLAVGRRYGVSDNAIRKWVRQYAREHATTEIGTPTLDPASATLRNEHSPADRAP
jgi:transposase-like protein